MEGRRLAGIGDSYAKHRFRAFLNKHLPIARLEIGGSNFDGANPRPLIQVGTLNLSPNEKRGYTGGNSRDNRSESDPMVWLVPEAFYGWLWAGFGATVITIGVLCAGSQSGKL